MAMPLPPDPRASRIIEAVYRLLLSKNSWPSFTELDRFLDLGRTGRGSSADCASTRLSPWLARAPVRDDQKIALTMRTRLWRPSLRGSCRIGVDYSLGE